MEIGQPYSRLLMRLERYSDLSFDDRQRLINLPLKVANFSADQEVVSHGGSSPRCTLVLSGFLYSHRIAAESRRQITSFFVPGDVADLSSFYLPKVHFGLRALGPTVVAFIPHPSLKEALDTSPALARALWSETLMQTAVLQEWIVNLGRRDAIARIAHVLCELTVRLQAVGLAREFGFSMHWTQMDVADASGVSNVHANRVIQQLRQLGLVEWKSKYVKIQDWDALARLGDFNDDYLKFPVTFRKDRALSGQKA